MESTSTVRSHLASSIASQPATESSRPERQPIGTAPAPGTADLLQRLYGPVLDSMAEVEQRLNLELQSPFESIAELLRHGTQLGGKRMRPALVLLSGAATGTIHSEHVIVGTVIEMVHTATLVHDDVLDDAQSRRHVPTVNARWNNHTSILLGDYLFAQAYRLAATLASTTACQWIGEAARLVCEGELRQVLQRDAIELDEETYLDVIRGKTAELCRVGCQLGAYLSGADANQVSALAHYGNALGIAFQIADDFLDLWGEDQRVGKTLGTDIQQGKMTLPIIRLLATAKPTDRAAIVRVLRGPVDQRLSRIMPWLQRSDAHQYTRQVAMQYRQQAVDALAELSPSAATAALTAIADFSVDRRF